MLESTWASKRRGNLDDWNAAHVDRSHETRHVANDPAAHRNHRRLPRQLQVDHAVQQARNGGQRSWPARHPESERREISFSDGCPTAFKNSRLRNNQERASEAGCFKMFFDILEDAGADNDVVGRIA